MIKILNESNKIDNKIRKDFIETIVKPNLAKGVGNKGNKIINSYAKKHNLDPDEVASLWLDAISELT